MSSHIFVIVQNCCLSCENNSDTSFLLVVFATRADLRVAFADCGGMAGMATPSKWTVAEPLATTFLRFPTVFGGSKSISTGSMWPMAFASVVEYTLRLRGAAWTGDLGASLIAMSRARRPVDIIIYPNVSDEMKRKMTYHRWSNSSFVSSKGRTHVRSDPRMSSRWIERRDHRPVVSD